MLWFYGAKSQLFNDFLQGRRVELVVVNLIKSHFETDHIRFDEISSAEGAYATITEDYVSTSSLLVILIFLECSIFKVLFAVGNNVRYIESGRNSSGSGTERWLRPFLHFGELTRREVSSQLAATSASPRRLLGLLGQCR